MKSLLFVVLICCLMQAIILPLACTPAEQTSKSGDPIKLAIMGPMKHMHGNQIWWGASMGADEINKMGGVQVGDVKRPLQLIKIDSNDLESIPDSVLAIEKAITVDKAHALFGVYRSEAILAMQDVAAEYKKIFLHCGSAPEITKRLVDNWDKYKYCFRNHPSAYMALAPFKGSLEQAINLVKESLGIQKPKIATIAEKLAWVDPLAKMSSSWITELGGEPVGLWRPSATASDVSAELAAVKNSGAHIIYAITGGPVGIPLQKQWAELQIPTALCGINGQATTSGFVEATANKQDYCVSWQVAARVAMTDKTIPFWDKFEKQYGATPTEVGVQNYEAMYIIADAIKRAGTADDSEALRIALEQTDLSLIEGRIMFYGKDKVVPPGAALADYCYPHDRVFGPGYWTTVEVQWINGKVEVIWPYDWNGITYPGTKKMQLAPWVIEYWKGK